jgi:hypothetical protein
VGRVGRSVVAAFDAAVMGVAAYVDTGGSIALRPGELVLWGSAVAAALCSLVIYVGGSSLVAWAAIGYVLFGALLTAGGPHWPLLALSIALMPLVPRPRGSFWIGLALSCVVALGTRYAIGALIL